MPFTKTEPRSVQLFGKPVQWVEDARYLVMTVDKRLNLSKHGSGEKENGAEAGSAVNSSKQEKRCLHQEWCSAV